MKKKESGRYVLSGIQWDADDDGETEGLPSEATLDVAGSGLEGLTEDQLVEYGFADWLTDRWGFCVKSFDWRPDKGETGGAEAYGKGMTGKYRIAYMPESGGGIPAGWVVMESGTDRLAHSRRVVFRTREEAEGFASAIEAAEKANVPGASAHNKGVKEQTT